MTSTPEIAAAAAGPPSPPRPAHTAPFVAPDLPPTPTPKHAKLGSWEFYRSIGSPQHVVAPMVDQSELAWRLLSKSPLDPKLSGAPEALTIAVPNAADPAGPSTSKTLYRYPGGAHLSYTPMIHAKVFLASKPASRGGDPQFNLTDAEEGSDAVLAGIEGGDRPLFAQFCANDPEILLAAARKVEHAVDAVDINFGCPQGIAKKGHYGSFLQEDWPLVARLISTLHENLKVPVTAKFRIFPEVEKTIAYARMMEAAGAQILTCHGRVRAQKGQWTGLADWEQIAAVKKAVSVPVFANGNLLYSDDVARCMEETGVDGVMSAEGNLSNPALFASPDSEHAYVSCLALARRYLDIVDALKTPTSGSALKAHMFRLLRPLLDTQEDLRGIVGKTGLLPDDRTTHYREMLDLIASRLGEVSTTMRATPLDPRTGYRTLPVHIAQPYIRAKPISSEVGGVDEFVSEAPSRAGSAGPSRGPSPPAPTVGVPSTSTSAPRPAMCVGTSAAGGTACPDFAATKCPVTACLVHCRAIHAIKGGMDAEEAHTQALGGRLAGQGCAAHEEKAAARSNRRKEKRDSRRSKKERKKAGGESVKKVVKGPLAGKDEGKRERSGTPVEGQPAKKAKEDVAEVNGHGLDGGEEAALNA